MTPSELRLWAHGYSLRSDPQLMTIDNDAKGLLLKLTDPTPITEEFAAIVNDHTTASLREYRSPRWQYRHTDTAGRLLSECYVLTVGDVNTQLWRAGLLDQMELLV